MIESANPVNIFNGRTGPFQFAPVKQQRYNDSLYVQW